jgi:hypothetical protein
MRGKKVTLYSLPYVVGVANFLAVAQQVAPPIKSLDISHTTKIGQTIAGQTVNRALKEDRLPSPRATSKRPWETKIRSPVPSTVGQIVVEPATT